MTELSADDLLRVARVDHVVLGRANTPPSPVMFQRMVRELSQARTEVGRRLVLIMVYGPDVKPPPTEERKAVLEVAPGVLEHCDRIALIVEATGFRSSMLRAALGGVMLVMGARLGSKLTIHENMDKALEALQLVDADVTRIRSELRAIGYQGR